MPLNYVDICIALYDYTAQTDDELTFHEDDVLYILENDDEDWWKAKLKIANTEGAESSEEQSIGLVPRNYIQAAECTAVLKALWDYEANSEEELSFKEDDMLNLYEEDEDGWYLVKFNNLFGMIPPNYVEKVSMDSVEQDTQEENYEDEGESENQINKSKTVSCFDAVSSPSDQNNTYVDPLKLYAVKAARPKAGSSASESKTWSVTEVVGDKKKQKKKGTLVIGNGRVIFASGSDKAPVRQWEINDIIDIKKDKKNKSISFTFGGSKGGTIEFQAHKNIIMEIHQKSEDCRASLEIPTVKVNSASIRSSISSPTLSTSSRPSSTHKSIESEEPQNEDIDQYEEQDSRSSSHQNLPEEEEEEEEEEAELTSPKFGVALYDFDAQGDDEVSIREGDELWIIDDFSSEEWWKVRKDDEEGVVPASFIELRSEEDNEAEKAAQAAAQAAAEAAAAEAAAEAERRLEEEERIKREEEKRCRQREEEDRKRREAEKRVQEEKKRKAATQSQPPPPPPVLSNRPVRANPSLDEEAVRKIQTPANRALPERPLQAQSKSKPIPSNTRTWTDRTGTFKVEAQFLQLVDGKVHLHKLNGVKISVPVDKMSKEDLAYLEEITGEKVYDRNDDTPLAAIAAAYKGKARYVDYNWYDFFLNAGVSHEDAFEYAKMFLAEKMDESSISDLDRDVMKGLGIKEGDIIRIKKYIDQKYNSGKKRTVSFGTTSVIPDDIDRQSRNKQSARKTQSEDAKKAQQLSEFDVKMQMKRDEQFARELQEEENRIARSEGRQIPKAAELYGNLDSIIQREEKKTPTTTTPQLFSANNGVLKNNTKKARPQPTKSASIQIDAKTLVDAKGSFNEAFKSSSLATSAENKFDDDAWASKDLTPPLVPTVKAPTPPPPPPPPPPSSISQTPPSVPVRPSNLLSSSNLSLNSSTPVNQNQISPRLPLVTPSLSTNPNSGSSTTGQFSMNWNSNNMNIQSSQLVSPPIPPPPPQQPIVIPLNNTLHPPLIPSKPFPNNTNNNMNIVNNTQGNNVFNTMNIQRSNSTSNFQGMSTNNLNNLSGPGGNFDSSTSAWNSTSLTSNSTSGYSLPNQFNSNTNQLQQLQIQQTTIQLQQLQLQSSSNQSQQLQSQQSSKYDPQNVFASMKAGQFGPIAPTSNLGANSSQDRYSVFKQVDPNAPSIFNNPNSAMNPSSGMGFGQGGFVNSNPANWNQNNFRGTGVPQQTSNFGIQQNPGFGFSGQSNQLNSQGFNPNQGLNNLGLNNQGFNTNPGFNNNNQQNPGGFNKQW